MTPPSLVLLSAQLVGRAVIAGEVQRVADNPLADRAYRYGARGSGRRGRRIIRYGLQFTGDDGKPYELVGQKDIRWRDPIHSFTFLPAEILDRGHRRIGTCRTTFDLKRHWWGFLRSFRPR